MNFLCILVKKIQEDPTAKISLTVGKFQELQKHLVDCKDCNLIIDEINEKYKDVPLSSDSDWARAKYN